MGFFLTVLFIGFLPQNTVAVTTAYILEFLRDDRIVTILHNSFPFPQFLVTNMRRWISPSVGRIVKRFFSTCLLVLIVLFLRE
jgi:hypothetical protein